LLQWHWYPATCSAVRSNYRAALPCAHLPRLRCISTNPGALGLFCF